MSVPNYQAIAGGSLTPPELRIAFGSKLRRTHPVWPRMTEFESLIVCHILAARKTRPAEFSRLDKKYIDNRAFWLVRRRSRLADIRLSDLDTAHAQPSNDLSPHHVARFMRLGFKYRSLLPAELAVVAAMKTGGRKA